MFALTGVAAGRHTWDLQDALQLTAQLSNASNTSMFQKKFHEINKLQEYTEGLDEQQLRAHGLIQQLASVAATAIGLLCNDQHIQQRSKFKLRQTPICQLATDNVLMGAFSCYNYALYRTCNKGDVAWQQQMIHEAVTAGGRRSEPPCMSLLMNQISSSSRHMCSCMSYPFSCVQWLSA